MEIVADLHVHSRYSRATSGELDLEHLYLWAQRKGIQIVGTGDFTHPVWFGALEEKLVPAEEGLFRLRPELEGLLADAVPPACAAPVRFLLSTEISNIYKRGERTRKVHNLVCLPSLEAASALARALSRIGNLASDGRPILGLDSRDLLELVLETAPGGLLIPAHIWTPWFSALGSRSGFDSIAECYRDLEPEIVAVETGLSSDPPMNWRISSLDRYALVSSSDAHSPQKLGREATLFDCELSYDGLLSALRTRRGLTGTLELFPEEGKYHFDGHRGCGVRLAPAESRARAGRCPVCGRPITLGVMYRIEELADRPEGARPERAAPFTSLCGLAEVLAEVQGVGASSVSVLRARDLLTARLGPELRLLRDLPEEELRKAGGTLLAEAVLRMRRGEVETEGGFDGEFGRVHLLRPEERRALAGQSTLFAALPPPRRRRERSAAATAGHQPVARVPAEEPAAGTLDLFARLPAPRDPLAELGAEQREAAGHRGSPVLIVAGPGTGKTHTLTRRIASRVLAGTSPAQVLAVTFTVKAAGELRARLTTLLGEPRARAIRACTFHALALAILDDARRVEARPPLTVLGEAERQALLAELWPEATARELSRIGDALRLASEAPGASDPADRERFAAALAAREAIELDGLCPAAVELLGQDPGLLGRWRERSRMVCVDEYQDLNQAQYQLVRLLCPADDPALDLCVIGDPDQAIYGFRGADPRYFLRFAEDYPGSARFALERSFRSPRVVLEAAAALIGHNHARLPTRTFSDLPGPPRLSLLRAETPEAEAELVVARIERALGGTSLLTSEDEGTGALSFSEVAVLFRTRAQADALRRGFERSGIPCRSTAGRRGTEELEPVLAFLRAALGDPAGLDEGAEAREGIELRRAVEPLAPRAALAALCDALCHGDERVAALAAADRLAALLYDLRGAGLASWAPGLLALCATCDEPDALTGEAVSLLTLHAAKGLEFSSVTIVGCEEGLLPQLRAEGDLEEERRLFYVGMTRARRTLTLTWAARRGGGLRAPSRFLEELPLELVERDSPRLRRRRPQLALFR